MLTLKLAWYLFWSGILVVNCLSEEWQHDRAEFYRMVFVVTVSVFAIWLPAFFAIS